jgi:CheY-like chemotaxis protein/mannose-6-phosphate isomerase-like protein (cupin superfamily)
MARVEQTWGSEETWAATDRYVARTLLLRKGASPGPMRHPDRDKTLRVQHGVVTVRIALETSEAIRDAHPGETVYIGPGVRHCFTAVSDAEIIEVSTPDRSPAAEGTAREATAKGAAPPPGSASLDPIASGELDPELVIDDPEIVAAPPPRPAVERPGAPVVVVVEDDLQIQDLLVRALGSRHTVHRADDGAQALALLSALPAVDLVITDLMMPRMNGLDLVRELKADPVRGRVPVIILTARASSTDVAAAINAGARSYVTKPFKLKELLAQVEKITGAR